MAKKSKKSVRHPFLVNWDEINKESTNNKPVKRKIKNSPIKNANNTKTPKKTIKLDNLNSSASIKREVLKSLMFASVILALELVIYFSLQA